jgi:hypothetical protein
VLPWDGLAGLWRLLLPGSISLRVLPGDWLLRLCRRLRCVRRLRFCRRRFFSLWFLLLLVLLGHCAGDQRKRTANQYGYEFFHLTFFVGFICRLFENSGITERLFVPG